MKMWSGRFRQPLDPQFEKWQRSFDFDRRLLGYELAASAAHARALKNVGVLSADELISVLKGLQQIGAMIAHVSQKQRDPSAGSGQAMGHPTPTELIEDAEAEDVHHFVEKQLVARIGDVGYKLHSGRSRNEQIATDLRLFVRAFIDELRKELAEVCAAFIDRAEKADGAAMPAYTHLQHAEPVLVAHWLLAYVEMFLRDADRLADCRRRLNLCPLGSGAVAGATNIEFIGIAEDTDQRIVLTFTATTSIADNNANAILRLQFQRADGSNTGGAVNIGPDDGASGTGLFRQVTGDGDLNIEAGEVWSFDISSSVGSRPSFVLSSLSTLRTLTWRCATWTGTRIVRPWFCRPR